MNSRIAFFFECNPIILLVDKDLTIAFAAKPTIDVFAYRTTDLRYSSYADWAMKLQLEHIGS